MIMIGQYHFVLLPKAEAKAFERHMFAEVFERLQVLQLTRITSGFEHQLLAGAHRRYTWQCTAHLVTAAGYDFEQNRERIQEAVADHAVLVGIETLTRVEAPAISDDQASTEPL